MKPLFFSPFVLLSVFVLLPVAVLAEQDAVRSGAPMIELVTLREMPNYSLPSDTATTVSASVYSGERLVIPMPYTAAKPPEMPIPTQPETFVLGPLLPMQHRSPLTAVEGTAPMDTIRGQTRIEASSGILDTSPPLPRGPAELDTIDSKLTDSLDPVDWDFDHIAGPPGTGGSEPPSGKNSAENYSVLVFATIFTTLGLIYMAFIAYDYHQRWIHSMTSQNDRYIIGGAFEMDTEDLYGSSRSFSESFGISDGIGLARRPI